MSSLILAAVPAWWGLTRVYRANLPEEARELATAELHADLHAFLALPLDDAGLDTLKKSLSRSPNSQALMWNVTRLSSDLMPRVQSIVTEKDSQEARIAQFRSIADEVRPPDEGSITLFLTQDSSRDGCDAVLTMGPERYGWVMLSKCEDPDRIPDALALPLIQFRSLLTSARDSDAKQSAENHVIFSLLNENSTAKHVKWDSHVIPTALRPFFDAISGIMNFTIDTQVLHYAPLVNPPTWDPGRSAFTMPSTALRFFLNSDGWNLGSGFKATVPSMHMVLYVPSPKHQPFLVLKESGETLSTNAFGVENWGGVYIHNSSETETHLGVAELHAACAAFLGLLCQELQCPHVAREKLGVDGDKLELLWNHDTSIATWEVDTMALNRLQTMLRGTKSKLVALLDLVEGLPSIVVGDEVGQQANRAMAHHQEAMAAMQQGRVYDALKSATVAYQLATDAFHHPTMMAMLYFPDEHKMAVYLPLLLPMLVPLVTNTMREVKRWRKGEDVGSTSAASAGGS